MKARKVNPLAIVALKEALTYIYWYKKDLRTFLINTLSNPTILGGINWDDYKRNIVDRVVNVLLSNKEEYQSDLLELMTSVAAIDDFSHLKRLENGEDKARDARMAVNALRKYTAGHKILIDEKQKAVERHQAYVDSLAKVTDVKAKLKDLNREFGQLVVSSDKQARGYRLESILREIFALFDLDPRASFRIEGEQIDGSFTFEGIDYLFEAKWQDGCVGAHALDAFAAKVTRKLDNTLGLFLAINGFSPDAVSAHSYGRRVLLLMDGGDLSAVLEGRIDLDNLLLRKRRHASQTGDIYLRARDLL